jgi:hypothetical protein
MIDQESVHHLAEKYRNEGYKVFFGPGISSDLPPFLRDAGADLIALKGDEIITVQTQSVGSAEPVIVAAEYDAKYGLSLLAEAEQLLTPETLRSALLTSWAALEGIVRVILDHPLEAERSVPHDFLQQLLNAEHISRSEYLLLMECRLLRNAVSHGVRPAGVEPDQVLFLVGLCRRLAQVPRKGDAGPDSVSLTVMRGKVNQDEYIRKLVEQADVVLREILGKNRGTATVEWDRAEDASGGNVITLTLSDFTGSVTGTFAPGELESKAHLRGRLYRLWGDLLSMRAREAANKLQQMTGS